MDKKRILFVAINDYANVLTNWGKAINNYSSNYEAITICLNKSIYYSNDIIITQKMIIRKRKKHKSIIQKVKEWVNVAEYIISGYESRDIYKGSDFSILCKMLKLTYPEILKSKKISIFHAGSVFRSKHVEIDNIILRYCNHTQIYAPDLFRLASNITKNEVLYPLPCFDYDRKSIDKFIDNRFNDKLLILHSPSKTKVKGTKKIKKVLDKFFEDDYIKNKYTYIITKPRTEFNEIVRLKQLASIYIDVYSIDKYSTFALASLESLASGNIVFSSLLNITEETLKRMCIDVETFPIINTGNTDEEFLDKLYDICCLSKSELKNKMIESYKYYSRNMNKQKFYNEFEKKILNE